MSRILFGVTLSIVLVGISYFTAKIYATAFRFNGIQTRIGFLTFLLIPLLFAASFIISRSAAFGSPLIYTTIQIIAGTGLYVFISALVLAIISGVAILAHTALPIWVAWKLLALALLCTIIGIIQSRTIVVREYSVTLPGISDSWNGKTAALVSDTHFGLVNHAHFSDKIVDRIIALHPDFVLHAGDFYDGPAIDTAPITQSWRRLADRIPVFYAPGNHEGYGDYSTFIESIRAAGVTVLDDKKTIYDGIQIAGITYRSGKENPAAAAAITALNLDRTVPAILINHPPTSLVAAEAAAVDLQVSGHTHNGQFWPMNYIIKKIYGAYAHGMATYGTMTVITTSGVGTFGPPLRLFNPPEIILLRFKAK